MPELPEVETVRRGLTKLVESPVEVTHLKASTHRLRFPNPRGLKAKLVGRSLCGFQRRAKYLIFELDEGFLLNHLGMTGSWRVLEEKRKHDHLTLRFSDGRSLVYNDPRRFGFFDFFPRREDLESCKWFGHLGPEPLDKKHFHSEYLFEQTRKKKQPIKNLIMDQKVVVGVGNIYASEALFKAGIRPTKASQRLTQKESRQLHQSICEVIDSAIKAGGSTIRDFVSAGGSEGYFQHRFQVYGKAKKPCMTCGTLVKSQTLAGRNTFWCPSCQK